jgi:hypothetical protein
VSAGVPPPAAEPPQPCGRGKSNEPRALRLAWPAPDRIRRLTVLAVSAAHRSRRRLSRMVEGTPERLRLFFLPIWSVIPRMAKVIGSSWQELGRASNAALAFINFLGRQSSTLVGLATLVVALGTFLVA